MVRNTTPGLAQQYNLADVIASMLALEAEVRGLNRRIAEQDVTIGYLKNDIRTLNMGRPAKVCDYATNPFCECGAHDSKNYVVLSKPLHEMTLHELHLSYNEVEAVVAQSDAHQEHKDALLMDISKRIGKTVQRLTAE